MIKRLFALFTGWQKFCEGTKGLRRNVRTRTKMLDPNICYFVTILRSRFTHFLKSFGQKKMLFRSKTVSLGQEVHYYMVYITYYTEVNLQICNYPQKRRICRENSKYAFGGNSYGHFCPRRKAANVCYPALLKDE